ncbi:1,4-alpha-glucan branching protein GlgB [Miltoncostaea marina]|uniref:1,4-alpha-glucan branching protein GlgB n=1 Tax=Miltoncostaea marina TaxID=2843215 RepID=UPI001C3C542A|nr:1,4-alpha-glucan branching protein GlgB [Miltoncostaea marina]
MTPPTTGIEQDIALLAARDHHEPHRVLGAHPDDGGTALRVWWPGATAVRAIVDGGTVVELPHRANGLWEARVEGELVSAYEIEVEHGGRTVRGRDPYSFLPTVGELDRHLMGEGRHQRLWERLGAHPREVDGAPGVAFSVWAPSARSVSVVGDWNDWDGRIHPMRSLGSSGVWELFVPGIADGAHYKYEIRGADGSLRLKADPLANAAETPPKTASVVFESLHRWRDDDWMARRPGRRPHAEPVSIYEVHLPSWRRVPEEGDRSLTYRELGEQLGDYAVDMGFTHVELLPVMAHPFAGSWGYQVTSYFAPTPTLGSPDDLREMVDRLHERGLGVILDWVPAHFPRDEFALARFDGTALYEHEDPRRGAHPDWGTLVFNYGRNEVRNFLVASALYWLREYHADGVRVDAVASMLYRDYSRAAGEWVPNEHGGREDLEAIAFLRELNEITHAEEPGVIMAAEESTAWPAVSRPTSAGGLGFDLKWNMGWMHDTLRYFELDPIHRRYHHDELTFSLVYAFTEQFVLPLSHDEVVHGKGSLLGKMPGDDWQKHANLRALYAYMWSHPGKKLLFMGCEIGQEQEWSHERSLDWHLLERPRHAGVQRLVRDINRTYRATPALWELDAEGAGFRWLVVDDRDANVVAYARFPASGAPLVAVLNLSPVPRSGYRLPLPRGGFWREALNTDAEEYGGAGIGNLGGVTAQETPWGGESWSAEVTLPPLAGLWLTADG